MSVAKHKPKELICQKCRDGFIPISFTKSFMLQNNHYFQYSTLFLYDSTLKDTIRRYKFKKEIRLNNVLVNIFIEHLNLISDYDLIIPVPSHPITNIKRGFIPMYILAKKISEITKIPVEYILKMNILNLFNQNQKTKNRKERLSNKGNRFYIRMINRSKIINKKILLIDDVITTGSTITECSELLFKYGAKEVEGLALAATPL